MVLNVCVPPLEDQERQSRLDQVLSCALAYREVRVVRRAEELELRPGGRLLFALALDGAGQNSEYQRMLARLRLEHPEISLRELSDLLPERLSRSGVNHRLRRIVEFADKLS